ncbi:MAG: UDPGP type 1 family protein [Myxococcota bacterium]|nr:UDPGP type 1 family protein [Myxococcota bacterium]
MEDRPQELGLEEVCGALARHEQSHVLAHWDGLDAAGRERLLSQLGRLAPQLSGLIAAYRAGLPSGSEAPRKPRMEPADVVALPQPGSGTVRAESARKRGEAMLAEGRLGVFLVAGGQGTRLGFPHPKGCFPVGPVSDRSLFEIQAQKIRGLARRAGCVVPWYIMTSDATDAETREAFEENRYFGLDPGNVKIFQQEMVPAFDFEGRLILERPDRVFENPNGHGGSLTALETSGALDDMDGRGIDTLFYYQVDNPLVKIGDPVYLGFHDELGAEISCKVVRKHDPMEKVGVVARIDGRVGVVEYTELADEERHARDDQGQLLFWAGNIAVHLLGTGFVRRLAADAFAFLPFHLSAKKIPFVDSQGRSQVPEAPNGYKLERFVFDALQAADTVCVVETTALEEFSPLKNADGVDSAQSCRRDLIAQYRRWLQAGGIEVAQEVEAIEIDHSVIDGPGEVAAAGFKTLADAGTAVRTANGPSA